MPQGLGSVRGTVAIMALVAAVSGCSSPDQAPATAELHQPEPAVAAAVAAPTPRQVTCGSREDAFEQAVLKQPGLSREELAGTGHAAALAEAFRVMRRGEDEFIQARSTPSDALYLGVVDEEVVSSYALEKERGSWASAGFGDCELRFVGARLQPATWRPAAVEPQSRTLHMAVESGVCKGYREPVVKHIDVQESPDTIAVTVWLNDPYRESVDRWRREKREHPSPPLRGRGGRPIADVRVCAGVGLLFTKSIVLAAPIGSREIVDGGAVTLP